MDTLPRERLETLIKATREHPTAGFYREKWGAATAFAELPTVSRADLIAAPLSSRHYSSDIGMVKVVRDEQGSFLSPWSFSDIAGEPFGVLSKRPMVYMTDPHEALEKSMWCYEHNMLPVVGEKDPEMAIFAAEAYQIDSLITDQASLPALHPYLSRAKDVAAISVIGPAFDIDVLLRFAAYTNELRLVLALPETGAIATATLSALPSFKPSRGCLIEEGKSLIVTKVASFAMPVIRYATGISSATLGL